MFLAGTPHPKTVNIWEDKKCQSPAPAPCPCPRESRCYCPSSSDLVGSSLSRFYSRVGDLVTRRAPGDAVVEGEVIPAFIHSSIHLFLHSSTGIHGV